MKNTSFSKLNVHLLACGAALAASLSASRADFTIFDDNFSSPGATRNDDSNDSADIQWRARVSSQSSKTSFYSVVADAAFTSGHALQWGTAGAYWVIGQFDNDASDGISLGSTSTPASLGPNVGDSFTISTDLRATAVPAAGVTIEPGLLYISPGPIVAEPGNAGGPADGTWIDPSQGYFLTIPDSSTAGNVSINRQLGVNSTVTAYQGANLSNILTGTVAATLGADTSLHTVKMVLSRAATGVQIDAYVDGTNCAEAVDTSSTAITQFNTFALVWSGAGGIYRFSNVKLVSHSAGGYTAPVAVNDSYSLTDNKSALVVAAPGVLGNDTGSGTLTVTNASTPAHGTLTINQDGSFTYTPNTGDPGYFGSDSFTYQAFDGVTNSTPATVAFTAATGNYTWNGGSDGSWYTAANWSANDLPFGKSVRYDSTSTGNLTETLNHIWSINGLTIADVANPITIQSGYPLTNNGNIDMSSAAADLTIMADYASLNGTALIAANRTLTLSNVFGSLDRSAGPGTMRIFGTVSTTNLTGLLINLTNSLTLILDGAISRGTPPVRLTAEPNGIVRVIVTNNGTLDMDPGGSTTRIRVGDPASVTGTNILDLESGSILIGAVPSGTGPDGIFVPNDNCFGFFNVNGGAVYITNRFTTNNAPAGETTLRIPANVAGSGVVNLNGGVLTVAQIDAAAQTATNSGTLDFNGTVVVANRTNSTWIAGVQHAYVQSGGANFDTGIYDVGIPENLVAGSPSGGLTKMGNGILRLTGTNNYTGATILGAGTLTVTVNSYPTNSALLVSNNAALAVDLSAVPRTISPASITLSGSVLNLSLGTVTGNPATAPLAGSGAVPLSLTLTNVINVAGTGLTNGNVPLIAYSGSLSPSAFSAFQLGSLPAGLYGTLSNDTINGQVLLLLDRIPVATNDSYGMIKNKVLNVSAPGVLVNDIDADHDPLTAVKLTDPGHGTVALNTNGGFAYTPTIGFVGPDSFTYAANDGLVNSAAATVTVNVTDQTPVANADSYSMPKNTLLTVSAPGVLGNDTDADSDPLTAVKVTDPGHGTLALSTNGGFTYTPTSGYVGGDSFTYSAYDGFAYSVAATVTVTVSNRPPVAADDAYSLAKNTTLTVAAPGVLANDSDPDSDAITAAKLTDPAHGSVTLSTDGSLSYTPTTDYVGADSFTYQAGDGMTNSAAATVSLTITNTTAARPSLAAALSGTNLVLVVTNGPINAPAWLLQGTNPAQPMVSWTNIYSNVLDGTGSLRITNPMNKSLRQQLYRLQLP